MQSLYNFAVLEQFIQGPEFGLQYLIHFRLRIHRSQTVAHSSEKVGCLARQKLTLLISGDARAPLVVLLFIWSETMLARFVTG